MMLPVDMAAKGNNDCFFANQPLQDALSEVGVFAIDHETQQTFPSRVWSELKEHFGVRSGTYDHIQLIHPDDRERVHANLERLNAGEIVEFSETFRIANPGGSYRWIRSHGRTVSQTEEGKPRLYIGADWDITDLKNTEQQLLRVNAKERRRSEEIETLRQVGVAIGASLDLQETVHRVLDETRRIISYDTATVQILEDTHLRVIGGVGFVDLPKIMKLRFPYPEERSISTRAIQRQRPFLTNDVVNEFPTFVQPNDTSPVRSWMGIPLVRRGDVIGLMALDSFALDHFQEHDLEVAGLIAGHIAIALENARLHEEAYALAMEDALTKVGSRHRFQVEGRLLFETAKRSGHAIAVVLLDIDHFKRVNDSFGHDVGDAVLQRVAAAAQNELRTTDLIARYGGEEFVMLFPQANKSEAVAGVERIRKRLEQTVHPEMDRNVTVSGGVVQAIPQKMDTLETFVKRADEALYESKENGRNRTTVWRPAP